MVFRPSIDSGGSIVVSDDHIFVDTTARDAYFVAHPSELVDNLPVYITGTESLQMYKLATTSWLDITPTIQGPIGPTGTNGTFPVIHDLTEKTTLVDDDLFIIEDSEDSFATKKVKRSTVGSGGSGEVNTASNLGTGDDGEGLFSSKVGVDLQFKRIKAGTNVTLSSETNDVVINAAAPGESNTASNVGDGAGTIFKQKSGVDLQFKTVKAGTNVTVTNNGDDITIGSTASGTGDVIGPATNTDNKIPQWDGANSNTLKDGLAIGTTTGTIAAGDDSRFTDARTPTSHSHGNITNAGVIGETATLPIITGTGGILQAGSFGTDAGTFCQGNDARLSDARTPVDHATDHVTGGGDVIANAVAAGASGLMSGSDKTKLDGIASGAEVNVNADWNSATGDSQILNKPTLGTAAALDVGTDAGDVVQVQTGGKLPALDGSDLTNLPSGTTLPVADTTALVKDPADATKLVRIDAGSVTTGTTRVITMPDQDVDLTPYSLPTASGSTLGGIKVGSRLSIAGGVLSADEQSSSDHWISESGSFTATPASTSTLTMTSDRTAILFPGYGLEYTIGGTKYYGVIDAITSNLMTIAGASLSGDVTALRYTKTGVVQMPILIPGYYEDSTDADLIISDLGHTVAWRQGPAKLVRALFSSRVVDGSSNGYVNVRMGAALANGTAQAGAATTITLQSDSSAVDDYYNNMWIRIASGTGAGQSRKIADYVGTTKVATVAAWVTNPDATSVYGIAIPVISANNYSGLLIDNTSTKGTSVDLDIAKYGVVYGDPIRLMSLEGTAKDAQDLSAMLLFVMV